MHARVLRQISFVDRHVCSGAPEIVKETTDQELQVTFRRALFLLTPCACRDQCLVLHFLTCTKSACSQLRSWTMSLFTVRSVNAHGHQLARLLLLHACKGSLRFSWFISLLGVNDTGLLPRSCYKDGDHARAT